MRVILAAALMTVAACGGPKRSEDPKIQDQEIQRDLSWQLHGNPRFANIRISCVQGVVTLEGMVTDESDRDLARRIARDIPGVRDVKSQLQLRSR
jgi:osmotically-inducible protein OsmY